jgi:hypothetical protein
MVDCRYNLNSSCGHSGVPYTISVRSFITLVLGTSKQPLVQQEGLRYRYEIDSTLST